MRWPLYCQPDAFYPCPKQNVGNHEKIENYASVKTILTEVAHSHNKHA